MRVYHREGAGRPIRVLWTLEEAGLPYELTILSREEAAAAEHRARQPLGRVPVIETDDATLFESAALCLHVAELNPQAELIPAPGTVERASVYQWMFFAMTEIEPPAIQVFRAGSGGEAAAESAADRCQTAIDAVDAALGGEGYLIGHRFSVADIVLSEVARMPGRLGAGQPGATSPRTSIASRNGPPASGRRRSSPSPAVVSRAPSRVDSGADPSSNRCVEAVPGKAT